MSLPRPRELEDKIVALRIKGYDPLEVEKELGLKPNVVYSYLKKPDIDLRIREGRLKKVRDKLFERTQGVTVQTGFDKAGEPIYKDLPPDVPAVKLYLEYEEGYNPAVKVEQGRPGDFDLSDFHRAKEK
jgi:hypothetical protein